MTKVIKPSFSEKFKSKNAPTISGVETLLTALPIMKIGDVERLDPAASVRGRLLVVRDVLRRRCRSKAPSATCCT